MTTDDDDVRILARDRVFDGYFKVDRYRLRHRQFAGEMGPEITREVLERGHAAAVLPYDPDRDEVVLIEQFRVGPLAHGADNPWQLEIVAGIIEPGETAEAVVRREALEEAGTTIARLEPILGFYPSPGAVSEHIALYIGQTDTKGLGGIHGVAAEGEDIRATVHPLDEALTMLADGRIANAPAIIALQWLAATRETLRNKWRTGR